MTSSHPRLLKTVRAIDRFTEWSGFFLAWLVAPILFAMVYEVVARYAFDAPTIWAYEISYMFYGALFMLGTAFALRKGAHIRTDLFWHNFSSRTKGWIDLIAYVVFLFPGVIMVLWVGYEEAIYSFEIGERSEQTAWRPLMWPFKAAVPISALLLLIQGVSEVLKAWYAIRTGELLAEAGEVQV